MVGAPWRGLLLAALCLAATGCRHRAKPAVLPPLATAPVPLATPPEPKTPPQVQPVPLQPVPLPTVQLPRKPKKKKKIAAAPTVPPVTPPASPTLVASAAGDPGMSVIGALTAGGDARPETRQKATEMLAALEKRLAALSPDFAEKEKVQIARVRYFQRQAQTALNMGDADGALTLVTKGKLLLDDITK